MSLSHWIYRIGDREMHLHLLVVLRHASSLGFLLQSVVYFLPPSLFPFLWFTSGVFGSIYRPRPIRRDGKRSLFLRYRGTHRHDRAADSLWQCTLIWCCNFTIPDDASLLLFAVSSTSFGSITRFSLCLLFSLSLKIDPIPRWVVSLFLSLHRRRSRIRLEGSTFSFFLSFQTEMSCRLQRSQSSQIAPSKALQTLHWRYRERIVVRFRLISKAKGAGIALGSSLSIADSRSIRPSEHNQAS